MYINFQQNQVSRTVKTVNTNLFANNRKLHKFSTCNSNFEKSLLSDMDHIISLILNFLKFVYLCGDYNIDLLKITTNNVFYNLIRKYNIVWVNSKNNPTNQDM